LVDGSKIYILDFEVAHYGHPSFDIAFFCNHFLLKAIKNKVWSASYLNMLKYMMEIYFEEVSYMDNGILEKQSVQVLSLLLLARVDGKSPAEYITDESDKNLIRDLSYAMIEQKCKSFNDVISLAKDRIS
jgi:aminoglycoside phosphotransferase (APT) family kinase protein